MKFLTLIAIFAFAKVCTSISIKDKWKTWNNSTLAQICDSLKQVSDKSVDIFNESFLFYKFLFETKYADWHGDILEVINLAIHGNATKSDLLEMERLLISIDTLDHTINKRDLKKLQAKFKLFLTPSQTNYAINFYRAYSGDLTSLHDVILHLFADTRKAVRHLPEQKLFEIISHNNLLKEIHNNEQLCTLSFMDPFIRLFRQFNCFLQPSGHVFGKQGKANSDDRVLYHHYIIDTPLGELKKNVLEVINLAVNGNATTSDLAKVEYVLNNTARFTEHGTRRLIGELKKFQTIEQTNYTLDMLRSMNSVEHDFETHIADLFNRANETANRLSDEDRSALISQNKLLNTIYKHDKKRPNTFLDIFSVSVKNRNCLEPTVVNYCNAIKQSLHLNRFSIFSDILSLFTTVVAEASSNSLYLLFKYINDATISNAQRDVFDVINLAVKGNATSSDYVKVEKLLSDIGSIEHIDEFFPKLHTELATFQSPEQTDYTINFYQNLIGSTHTSKIVTTDMFIKANETLLNLPEVDRFELFSRNHLLNEIYRNEQLCV